MSEDETEVEAAARAVVERLECASRVLVPQFERGDCAEMARALRTWEAARAQAQVRLQEEVEEARAYEKRAIEETHRKAERVAALEAALVSRHGGEPLALLAELDAERAKVAALEKELELARAETETQAALNAATEEEFENLGAAVAFDNGRMVARNEHCKTHVQCAFCGSECLLGEEMQQHAEGCEKHPLGQAMKRIAALEAEKERLREALEKLVTVYTPSITMADGIIGLDWDSRPDPNAASDAWSAALAATKEKL